MKWAIYVRVSDPSQNTAGQKREIQRWLDGNGIQPGHCEWFVDAASGKGLERPEFERLQTAVFSGEVQAVVVWKLDRLSRNLRDGINTLADWCDRGLRVVSITQLIDFNLWERCWRPSSSGSRKWNARAFGNGRLSASKRRKREAFTWGANPAQQKRNRAEQRNSVRKD